jgi:small subunit ribosomal protein S1
MVNRNLIRELEPAQEELEKELQEAFSGVQPEEIDWGGTDLKPNDIVEGRVLRIEGDQVIMDVGYKCEGVVPLSDWGPDEPPPQPGQVLRVLVEDIEELYFPWLDLGTGMILLSKRKAERIDNWRKVMESVHEGDVVTGLVTRKIKGGLLVDIGVNVFLPASQVDIRRPADIGDFIGRYVQCEVLKIDEARRNIVVSRRALIEKERIDKKHQILSELQPGQRRKGIVKNIADFGAFVDLGGIDGLLHITDMSWGRVNHPSEVVTLEQEIEVVVLQVDREKEKIALGLKQKQPSPWENIEQRYPIGSQHKGEVVSMTPYGVFVRLEEGVEGLVHISEMSWTKRINHPSELVQVGDMIDVVILSINKEKQEISLGMKQTQENPWDHVAERYPPGSIVKGIVRNLTNYGAFIELEEGVDGLLHVTDMSWTRKITHPSELLHRGQEITCRVLSVDQERRRIALGLKQLTEDPWVREIPEKYQPGQIVTGTVTKITNFGVFVSLEDGLEGLLHISELADHKVDDPEEVVNVGDKIEVKILRVDPEDRKIGLSRKRVEWAQEEQAEAQAAEETPPAPKSRPPRELKGGVGSGSGPLIQPIASSQPPEPEQTEQSAPPESSD